VPQQVLPLVRKIEMDIIGLNSENLNVTLSGVVAWLDLNHPPLEGGSKPVRLRGGVMLGRKFKEQNDFFFL
jgi:hypothetical protein